MAKKSKKRTHESATEPREAEVVETETRRAEVTSAVSNPAARNVIIIVIVIIGLFFLMNFIFNRSGKTDKTASDETSQNKEGDESKTDESKDMAAAPTSLPDGTTVSETDEAFTYTVGDGESYTTVARRAIASTDGKLTTVERVAAETKLTTDAGAELLDVGQSVELSKDTVRAAIDWAKDLNDEEKAAWQPYADSVAW